ncbi:MULTISPECIES: acyl carrier protein [unclassified Streptomyces]|uniref:acyl carrier protein n=1 Tax=unclassified Streptomyces TaxID=2593676 RepID=UPI002E777690|nr:acyl carrier protein [Streptomyces sp. JV176]MEE1804791.1 acyl carrier protein [Streptomyces sp. JV176]
MSVTVDEIELKIKDVLAGVLPGDAAREAIGPDTDLIDEYGLDSLQVISFLLGIEDAFDIELDYENLRLDDLRSVRQFVGYVAGLGVAAR